MKRNKIILLLILYGFMANAIPLDTSFTYQGELKNSAGIAYNGLFDFRFEAFDASLENTGFSFGFFIADDVQVTDGIFTTQIDFDGGAFFGDKVWLEISVRDGNSTGGYQTLLPRQQVTATPYASHASFAQNIGINSVSTNEIINATIATADLANSSVSSAKIVDGTIVAADVNSAQVQRRVTTTCPAGQFMQAVNQDGTAVCVAETAGITSVTSAEIVDGTIAAVDIDNTQIQQRVSTVCSGGRVVKSINASGIATCVFPTPSDNSVNSTKVLDGSIVAADVDTNQIQQRINGSCIFPEYLTSVSQTGNVVCARMPIGVRIILDSTGNVGANTSIAIGADGNPIISYSDFSNAVLKVVKCSNPSCSTFNTPIALDSAGSVGFYTSIAIGTDGNPIISYYNDSNGDLKVVKCSNPGCSTANTPITLDSAGDVGSFTSIAIGTDGNPIISYSENPFNNGNLKVVKCSNPGCSTANTPTTLDSTGDVGTFTSIAIGTDDNPIISYYDGSNGDLKVVRCITSSCSLFTSPQTIDSAGDVGRYTSIAIGTDDNPIISYSDDTVFGNGNLKVVKCSNPICSTFNSPLTLDSAGTVGRFTSIAIGTDGNPIISYYDSNNDYLKVVKCSNPSCSTINTPIALDSAGVVGAYTSIAIGTDGNPIISYQDLSNGDLKVYSCGDANCSN